MQCCWSITFHPALVSGQFWEVTWKIQITAAWPGTSSLSPVSTSPLGKFSMGQRHQPFAAWFFRLRKTELECPSDTNMTQTIWTTWISRLTNMGVPSNRQVAGKRGCGRFSVWLQPPCTRTPHCRQLCLMATDHFTLPSCFPFKSWKMLPEHYWYPHIWCSMVTYGNHGDHCH